MEWIFTLFTLHFSVTPTGIPNSSNSGALATTKENATLVEIPSPIPPANTNKTEYMHDIWCDRKVPETVVLNKTPIISWEYADIHEDDGKDDSEVDEKAKLVCLGAAACYKHQKPNPPAELEKTI